ncbi:MAG: hypothetical protein KatS3mg050_3642 [Litorilinea sp.]|nr:MAG: hypothetical protein KatS3mg050_3642 [Litorilinea sp.]
MDHPKLLLYAVLLCACLSLMGCQRSEAPSPTPPAPQRIEVPVTVEVTRIITQQIVVEATPTPPQACRPESLDQAEEIRIGAIVPLSKPGAARYGFSMQAALTIAATDVNDSGGIQGKPVRLITYDSAGIPERAAQYAQRLITQDCVSAIVGIFHSNVGMAVAQVAHTFGIPLVVAEARADEITAQTLPEVFRIGPTNSMVGRWPAEWMASTGDRNGDGRLLAVLLAENSTYGQILDERLRQWLPQFGIETQTLPVDLPADDFTSVIARIVAMDTLPDAIFLLVQGESALNLAQQLLGAGIGPQRQTVLVMNSVALNSPLFWQRVPEGTGTVVARVGAWESTVGEMGRAFAGKYRQYFDTWPEGYAFTAYDSLRLVADALNRATTPAGDDLITALEESDVELAGGHYYFPYGRANPPDGETVPAYMWHQWPDYPLLFLQYTEAGQDAAAMPIIWPEKYRTEEAPASR